MPYEVEIVERDGHGRLLDRFPANDAGRWREACVRLVRQFEGDPPRDFDVCLGLPEFEAADFDRQELRNALEASCNMSWGADTYVVVRGFLSAPPGPDGGPSIPVKYEFRSCGAWMEAALEGGAIDVLQPLDALDHYEPREASRLRQLVLGSLPVDKPWRCVYPDSPDAFIVRAQCLLRDFRHTGPADDNTNLLLATEYDHTPENFLELCGRAACLVATINGEPNDNLGKLCDYRGIPCVVCEGPLEVRYALHQLKRRLSKTADPAGDYRADATDAPVPRIVEVTDGDREAFEDVPHAGKPTVLITNALHAEHERDLCIGASRDFGVLHRLAPGSPRWIRDLCITTRRMVDRIPKDQPLLAWVHVGHASKKEGICEYGQADPTAAVHWLSAFAQYHGALPLVLLLSCRSADAAWEFVKAGAGVAIGFAGDVAGDACRLLGRPVLDAALASGGSQNAIIGAYKIAHKLLFAANRSGYASAEPTAYIRKW